MNANPLLHRPTFSRIVAWESTKAFTIGLGSAGLVYLLATRVMSSMLVSRVALIRDFYPTVHCLELAASGVFGFVLGSLCSFEHSLNPWAKKRWLCALHEVLVEENPQRSRQKLEEQCGAFPGLRKVIQTWYPLAYRSCADPLSSAIERGDLQSIPLLSCFASAAQVHEAIVAAAALNSVEALSLLERSGINLRAKFNSNAGLVQQALGSAVLNKCPDSTKFLLDRGASPNLVIEAGTALQQGRRSLHLRTMDGSAPLLSVLLSNHTGFESPTREMATMKALLDAGANPLNLDVVTPLGLAHALWFLWSHKGPAFAMMLDRLDLSDDTVVLKVKKAGVEDFEIDACQMSDAVLRGRVEEWWQPSDRSLDKSDVAPRLRISEVFELVLSLQRVDAVMVLLCPAIKYLQTVEDDWPLEEALATGLGVLDANAILNWISRASKRELDRFETYRSPLAEFPLPKGFWRAHKQRVIDLAMGRPGSHHFLSSRLPLKTS